MGFEHLAFHRRRAIHCVRVRESEAEAVSSHLPVPIFYQLFGLRFDAPGTIPYAASRGVSLPLNGLLRTARPNRIWTWGRLPPAIKWLLISNSAIFVLYFLAWRLEIIPLVWLFHDVLSLTPDWVVKGAILWQPVTYLFLHSPTALVISCSICSCCGCSAPIWSGIGGPDVS